MSLEDLKKQANSDKEVEEYGEEYEARARKGAQESILAGSSMVLLGVSFATTMYAMKVMGSAGLDSLSADPQSTPLQ
jgi:hypothetical protein